MSEPYTLKKAVDKDVLNKLNNVERTYMTKTRRIFSSLNVSGDIDEIKIEQLEDWCAAVKSGKKIVNPMPPREIFQKNYYSTVDDIKTNPDDEGSKAFKAGMDCAYECFVKEHPDVADWLKEDDRNA